jgi:haloalkane dehalogenase
MWEPLMAELAAAGRASYAPDLYALGDSTGFGPATFENTLERFGEFMDGLPADPVVLVVHDWGGFIGLAWACENPERIEALVISAAGFFADGKWHGMAQTLRSERGEALVDALERDGFVALLNGRREVFSEAELEAYWQPFAEGHGRRATLDFYRSMDFSKLAPWQGKLGELGVPTLLLWGAEDEFAPLAAAERFEREIPGARLVVVDGAGHFVFDEEPGRCAEEVLGFLAETG